MKNPKKHIPESLSTTFSKAPRLIPRAISPSLLMADPQRLANALSSYFKLRLTTEDDSLPTFEGLALAAGFNSFNQMKKALFDETHKQESKDTIIVACAQIADFYQQHGLLDTLNASFIKYLLSAYLNISERSVSESHATEDRTVTVRWEESTVEALPHAAQKQLKEDTKSVTSLAQELAALEMEDLF